jgi:hypothetical protein
MHPCLVAHPSWQPRVGSDEPHNIDGAQHTRRCERRHTLTCRSVVVPAFSPLRPCESDGGALSCWGFTLDVGDTNTLMRKDYTDTELQLTITTVVEIMKRRNKGLL